MQGKDNKEVWMNPNAGVRYIQEQNFKGEFIAKEIAPGQKFTISTFDRMVNQEQAYSKDVDMFTNGTFSRVKLVESAEDYAELAENPNIMSESELEDIFGLTATQFKKKLAEIDNVRLLERLQELSQKEDLNVTVPQVKALEARLNEVSPDYGKLPVFTDYTDGKPIPVRSLS